MGKGEIVEELLDEDPEGAPGDEAALQYVSFLLALAKCKELVDHISGSNNRLYRM